MPRSLGTPMSEVPVSTIARQLPSAQKSRSTPPAEMDWTSSCQKPDSASLTSHHEKSPAPSRMRSGRHPPKVISLSSPSCLPRKTEKTLAEAVTPAPPLHAPAGTPDATKLKAGSWDKLARPRPKTPSNAKLLKGSSVMCVAEMSRSSTQPCATETGTAIPCAESMLTLTSPLLPPVLTLALVAGAVPPPAGGLPAWRRPRPSLLAPPASCNGPRQI
mmetsp:Transcript_6031/g.14404  ORF Transcript_6031/g.14404 Transcript_6031/m.14404 type:complete len:217 (-) Transcript_6031:537-1187(-)